MSKSVKVNLLAYFSLPLFIAYQTFVTMNAVFLLIIMWSKCDTDFMTKGDCPKLFFSVLQQFVVAYICDFNYIFIDLVGIYISNNIILLTALVPELWECSKEQNLPYDFLHIVWSHVWFCKIVSPPKKLLFQIHAGYSCFNQPVSRNVLLGSTCRFFSLWDEVHQNNINY